MIEKLFLPELTYKDQENYTGLAIWQNRQKINEIIDHLEQKTECEHEFKLHMSDDKYHKDEIICGKCGVSKSLPDQWEEKKEVIEDVIMTLQSITRIGLEEDISEAILKLKGLL